MDLGFLKKIYRDAPGFCGLDEAAENRGASSGRGRFSEGVSFLDGYLPYRYFDEETGIFICDGGYECFMLEIAPVVGADEVLSKNLRGFLKEGLPENSFLSFLLIAGHEVGDILRAWEGPRSNPLPALKKITRGRAESVMKGAASFGAADGSVARDYRIFVSFASPPKKIGTGPVIAFRDSFVERLASLKLGPRICGAVDLIKIIRTTLQPELTEKPEPLYRPYETLARQALESGRPLSVCDTRIDHTSSGLSTRVYLVEEAPPEFSPERAVGLLGDFSGTGIPARFAVCYSVSADIGASRAAGLRSRGKRVIEASEKWYSDGNRDLKREAAEWRDIIDRSANFGERFLTEFTTVIITAPTESIESAGQNLVSLYGANNFRLGPAKYLQLPCLLASLPMAAPNYRTIVRNFRLTRVVSSEEAAAKLPLYAEWKGVPKSGVLLRARRGQLFNFNPFYRISSGNYNLCVFAPSGGGKSVFLQELAVSMVAQNTKTFVLDIGLSFENIRALLGGETVRFGRDAPFSLNPFAGFYPGMNAGDREEFLKCAVGLLKSACGVGDDPRGSAELEKAIVTALRESGDALGMDRFADFLEKSGSDLLRKYGATLYPYTKEGLYGKYFSGSKKLTFESPITVFEFEEIKNDPRLLSMVLQILLMEITNRFLTGDRETPFMIIVDEAWMLLDFATAFFAAFVRTVRKYGGSLVICVQNFTDLHKSPDHRTILENSTWTVLLKQDEKGLGAFRESDAFKDMVPLIKSIGLSPGKYAEALICATGVAVVGRLVLDDYSKALYSTDPADFNFLKRKTAEGLTLDEAVEALAKEKRRK